MTKYNTLNVKLSDSNSIIKNDTEVSLNFLSNVICDSNGETIFHNKLFWSITSSNVICDSNDYNVLLLLSDTEVPKMWFMIKLTLYINYYYYYYYYYYC